MASAPTCSPHSAVVLDFLVNSALSEIICTVDLICVSLPDSIDIVLNIGDHLRWVSRLIRHIVLELTCRGSAEAPFNFVRHALSYYKDVSLT